MNWRMDGYHVLVTGASKGIGAEIAEVFLERGASVWLVAREQRALRQYARLLAEQHGEHRVLCSALDITDADQREGLLNELEASWGRLDCLINNVGSNIRLPAMEYSARIYQHLFATNLDSAFFLTQACHRWLCNSANASVVNIASVAGIAHMRTGVIYGMTKAAMLQMTRNLAVEWAADGIRVNAIAPWYTDTPLARQVLADEQYLESVLARTPLGRVATPEEMATATAFFCMPAASYVTGQCLSVDGGMGINFFS